MARSLSPAPSSLHLFPALLGLGGGALFGLGWVPLRPALHKLSCQPIISKESPASLLRVFPRLVAVVSLLLTWLVGCKVSVQQRTPYT